MEGFDRKSSEVGITITAPSDNERERSDASDENDEEDDNYDVDDSVAGSSRDSHDRKKNMNENEEDKNGGSIEELCDGFENGASLSEEKPAREEREGNGDDGQAAYEIVGDRVLVEKDGKFELVDANEIKAEYFEMLGIKNEDNEGDRSKTEAETSPKKEESSSQQRPKTTPVGGNRKNTQIPKKRVQSSWGDRYRNNEYDNIRSPYGLSEKQLEIKKRREEAIARRRKEEDERAQEEERRKREDAERAFQSTDTNSESGQAWLSSKREEERERRKTVVKEQTEESEMRATESEKAFEAWKAAKKIQKQEEREESTRRMEETASMYVIHDRGACEEAFRRWLKKKKDKKAKELEKKKKRRPRHKRKEPLPTNSDKIRFTDNHGYRNAVVY